MRISPYKNGGILLVKSHFLALTYLLFCIEALILFKIL
jgi:hypothetical protein